MDDHSEITVEPPEAPVQSKPSFWQRRMLVIALLFSFFSCLAAFSLVVNLFHLFDQMTPFRFWLFLFIRNNYIALIVAPLIGLVLSAGALYYVTRDIMSGPVRYLDERQKMVRDQAHSSAYTIMKFVLMVGVVGFVLFNTFMPTQTSQAQPTSVLAQLGVAYGGLTKVTYNSSGGAFSLHVSAVTSNIANQVAGVTWNTAGTQSLKGVAKSQMLHPVNMFYFSASTPNMTQWPTTPASAIFFYSTLLLCLFVMITSLPKAIAAWKKRL
jgi:hypothetical protein